MQTPNLGLRKLDSVADLSALQQILESAPRYSMNVSGSLQPDTAAADMFAALPENFDSSRKHVYGIYLDSKMVGCLDVLRGFPSVETAMIGLLLLDERQQGKGIGKAAYQTLESLISKWTEVSRLRIGVVETNNEVLGFWKKIGFKETGIRRAFQNRTVRSVTTVLEKTL